ncbi:hypothetical protein L3X38_010302 [Prunus dulcis]|uniref:Uncharacterized protein n=1 Tax=Prunus dulcis TaxID=3755 RepID=A0AAD4ZD65_PRUDU|nr:hypothetical protein L3X38_010302 [Prunus dulcis]
MAAPSLPSALDLEGYGQSRGLRAFIPGVHLAVQDCLAFFMEPEAFQGVILVAPICKISDKVKPGAILANKFNMSAKLAEKLIRSGDFNKRDSSGGIRQFTLFQVV